jgi:hypothetical protein
MTGSLPDDAEARNAIPLADGVLFYFPNALAEVAKVSKAGNDQHNPGQPMHWARGKSTDHANKIMRHLVDAGKRDGKGIRHSAYLAWRALALLQEEIERDEDVPLPKNARPAERVSEPMPPIVSHRLAGEIMRAAAEADDPAPHDGRTSLTYPVDEE